MNREWRVGEAVTGVMVKSSVRIAIVGCGTAARIHMDRLLTLDGVEIVGCADPRLTAAAALADRAMMAAKTPGAQPIPAVADHRELLRQLAPDAVAVFTPHLGHYRVAMDALQAGCHVLIEKPLSTNVQEAADIVNLARARQLIVGVGQQFRLCPSLIEARRRIAEGAIGSLNLVACILARPWLKTLGHEESAWRFDATASGVGGILSDAGDHLVDALLWTTGQVASEIAAVQTQRQSGVDLVTAAAIRLADGTPVTLAVTAIAPRTRLPVRLLWTSTAASARTEQILEEESSDVPRRVVPLDISSETIDANFVAAINGQAPLCCPAEQALDTVRLLEAITRSGDDRSTHPAHLSHSLLIGKGKDPSLSDPPR